MMLDGSRNVCSEQHDIENYFIKYYSTLWNSSSSYFEYGTGRAFLSYLHTLSFEGRALLSRHVSIQGLFHTIRSMAKGKIPGLDGLNVEFYY